MVGRVLVAIVLTQWLALIRSVHPPHLEEADHARVLRVRLHVREEPVHLDPPQQPWHVQQDVAELRNRPRLCEQPARAQSSAAEGPKQQQPKFDAT